MYISNLKLKNFRNYDYLNINFSKNKNIIYGNNAQGKTNIIEAIYIIANGKSQKICKDKELIKFNENEAHINATICGEKNNIIDIHLHKEQTKGIAVNKNKIKKISEFLNLTNLILFSPEDLNIIKDGPSIRRKFLDIENCKLSKNYIVNLINYNKVLNQRNNLLKEIKEINLLDVWDEQLFKYGKEIIIERNNFIEEIKKIVEEISYKISGQKEILKIDYEKNVSIEKFKENLIKNRENDIKYKITHTGPHRDDIKFLIDNNDIRYFGSQGQKRTAALSLKLAEIKLIKEKTKEEPILLLDDVFSELDETRQKYIVDAISNTQTIITATGIKNNIYNLLKADAIFEVKDGKVERV